MSVRTIDFYEVFLDVWRKYEVAVNAADSAAYGKLFTTSAIRIVPGTHPEVGRGKIQASEKRDYEIEQWCIKSVPVDVIRLSDDWIYGVASVHASITNRKTQKCVEKNINAAWLLQKQPFGDWLIARHVLNFREGL